MLSDEEKQAIEKLSSKKNETTWDDTIRQIKREEIKDVVVTRQKYITAVLKLIEKQSKEIEELKKDKLELINKNHVVHLKDVEKELREMRKVIDTKNAEIECLNIIHESYKDMVEENNFISKDKIKAKIEEYDKTLYYAETEEGMAELKDYEYDEAKYGKKILQSLLEKE